MLVNPLTYVQSFNDKMKTIVWNLLSDHIDDLQQRVYVCSEVKMYGRNSCRIADVLIQIPKKAIFVIEYKTTETDFTLRPKQEFVDQLLDTARVVKYNVYKKASTSDLDVALETTDCIKIIPVLVIRNVRKTDLKDKTIILNAHTAPVIETIL